MHEKLKDATILLLEIISLLVIFVVFLFVLNYFKIITLPNFSPKTITPAPTNAPATNNNQSAGVSFVKLQNQASQTQIQAYASSVVNFNSPGKDPQSTSYIADSIFSGYDNQTIQVVTKDGVLNLGFDANTQFEYSPPPTGNSGGMIAPPTAYASAADFFKAVTFGSTVEITFSKTNLKVSEVDYIQSIQPVR